jgi:hypothetical protein
VVAPDDGPALADAVAWLAANGDAAERMGRLGRVWARRRLRSVQAERLEEVLFGVVRAR